MTRCAAAVDTDPLHGGFALLLREADSRQIEALPRFHIRVSLDPTLENTDTPSAERAVSVEDQEGSGRVHHDSVPAISQESDRVPAGPPGAGGRIRPRKAANPGGRATSVERSRMPLDARRVRS